MIFIKDFVNMTDEQRSEAKVKGGRIHVNDRIYKAIIGRPIRR